MNKRRSKASAPAQVSTDYKESYRQIRNYLAGRFLGATRDEVLLHEVMKCIFCKISLKRSSKSLAGKDALAVSTEYRKAFANLRLRLPAVFTPTDEILLDPQSLYFIDGMLENIDIDNPVRDPIGDAYEVFVDSAARGQEGQFFTPQNAVELLVSMVAPKPGERVIDPACGAGGFLSAAARHLLRCGADPKEVGKSIFGIDKDSYLAGLASSHVSVITLEPSNVYCADSLAWASADPKSFELDDYHEKFDVVLTNPPFGVKISAASDEVQAQFELGYKWKLEPRTGIYQKANDLQSLMPPQVLFIERCIKLVRPGGRIGLVVPESLVSGKRYRHVVDYIRVRTHIRAVIGMPENLFKTSGKGGTHTKTCLLLLEKKEVPKADGSPDGIFMAEVKWCGHDSRGKQIAKDEIPDVWKHFQEYLAGSLVGREHLGYEVKSSALIDNVLAPRYYNPDIDNELLSLSDSHNLVRVSDLIDQGLLIISTGDEIGKLSYGTGEIPFVRTSDISNWEIKVDPKHCVSEEIYNSLASKQDVQEGDILMVRDGTYLIGTCAYVTKYDTRILYQSHLYKLRSSNPNALSPFILLAALSSDPVRKQIQSKRFTQDIIDSLGDRIKELVLPIPKSREHQERIIRMVSQAIYQRVEARELSRKACIELIGHSSDRGESHDEGPVLAESFTPA